MHVRTLVSRAAVLAALSLTVVACAGMPGQSSAPAPSPGATTAAPTPGVWPVASQEHIDLWLHTYAMLAPDSMPLPYFTRGYRDRMLALRRQRGVTSAFEQNRARLMARIAANPSLGTNGQFIPLYFPSGEVLRQVMDNYVRGATPRSTDDPALQQYLGLLANAFPTVADREWLRLFAEAADDESRKFFHDYWLTETRGRAAVAAQVDSSWRRTWRPALQRYLNNTQQASGELFLSLPIGGEGRTVQFGKGQNAFAVPLPASAGEAEQVLYVLAHELVGSVANSAIADHTTPAERREGVTSRYEQAAAVRAGAMLLERAMPSALTGYMRYYLQQVGRTVPSDPRAAFTAAFAVPDAVRDAIARQLEVILGGI